MLASGDEYPAIRLSVSAVVLLTIPGPGDDVAAAARRRVRRRRAIFSSSRRKLCCCSITMDESMSSLGRMLPHHRVTSHHRTSPTHLFSTNMRPPPLREEHTRRQAADTARGPAWQPPNTTTVPSCGPAPIVAGPSHCAPAPGRREQRSAGAPPALPPHCGAAGSEPPAAPACAACAGGCWGCCGAWCMSGGAPDCGGIGGGIIGNGTGPPGKGGMPGIPG